MNPPRPPIESATRPATDRSRLGAALRGLGLRALKPSLFACRAGELLHAVHVRKDRHGDLRVSPVVWHPCLFDDDGGPFPGNLVSPVQGDLSPRGVVPSWSWPEGTLDAAVAADTLAGFFAPFRTLDDLRNALDGGYVLPFFKERLADAAPRLDLAAHSGSQAAYAVPGGARSLDEARQACRDFLRAVVAPLGFQPAPGVDIVAIRERGELVDCVRILPDDFGTFASLLCFPWSRLAWAADRRWKGTYYPAVATPVPAEGGAWLAPVARLEAVDIEALRGQVAASLAHTAAGCATADDFIARLGGDFATLANAMRHLARRRTAGA